MIEPHAARHTTHALSQQPLKLKQWHLLHLFSYGHFSHTIIAWSLVISSLTPFAALACTPNFIKKERCCGCVPTSSHQAIVEESGSAATSVVCVVVSDRQRHLWIEQSSSFGSCDGVESTSSKSAGASILARNQSVTVGCRSVTASLVLNLGVQDGWSFAVSTCRTTKQGSGDVLTSLVRPVQDTAFAVFYLLSGLQGWWSQSYELDDADPPLEKNWLLHTCVVSRKPAKEGRMELQSI
jgi:hypothetical protein